MFIKLIIKIAKYLSNFKFSNNFLKKRIYNLIFIFNENFLFNNNKLEYLSKLKRKKNKNINIFVVPFWGEIYTKSFFENLLPSLKSKNNLEWMKKKYNLEIHLYVDSNFRDFQKKYDIANKFFISNNLDLKIYRFHSMLRLVYTKDSVKDRASRDFLELKKNKLISKFQNYIRNKNIYIPSSGIMFQSYSHEKKDIDYIIKEFKKGSLKIFKKK